MSQIKEKESKVCDGGRRGQQHKLEIFSLPPPQVVFHGPVPTKSTHTQEAEAGGFLTSGGRLLHKATCRLAGVHSKACLKLIACIKTFRQTDRHAYKHSKG